MCNNCQYKGTAATLPPNNRKQSALEMAQSSGMWFSGEQARDKTVELMCQFSDAEKKELKKQAGEAFLAGFQTAEPKWIPVSERLPNLVDKKSKKLLIEDEKGHIHLGYYFPDKFKTVEWEDWDDYNQLDFPYTTEDREKGTVWLNAGFYATIDECERCGGWWSSPIPAVSWCPIPESLLNFKP